ncbi:MAG: hypothetical protein RIG84_00915 [Roseovarius sp.]
MNDRTLEKGVEPDQLDRPDLCFDDPMDLVDSEEIAHETRLDMLQTWLAHLAEGKAGNGTREDVKGAIYALQARSKLKTDMPREQPAVTTYGGVERSNLKRYGFWRVLRRLSGAFRR